MSTEVIMPKVDMDMDEGTLSHWHKQEGDSVEKGEPLFDIETDKSTMEIEAPASGILHQVIANAGDVISIGNRIARIYAEGEEVDTGDEPEPANEIHNDVRQSDSAATSPAQLATDQTLPPAPVDNKVRATPLARRTAENHGVMLTDVTGSGPRGRITRKDVEVFQESVSGARNREPDSVASAATLDTLAVADKSRLDALGVSYQLRELSTMRKTIARRLTESKSAVPHFYIESTCQVDKLKSYRADLNNSTRGNNQSKLTINDMIVKACACALRDEPDANVCWAGNQIIQFEDSNISVAVSVNGGLMTPVIRRVETKSLLQVSTELANLAERARDNKLKTAECQGGSMSVSNLGMFGVEKFNAIINPPESMILAVGAAREQLTLDESGMPSIFNVMTVTLSCDHRVIDGAIAARWLQAFRNYIESPMRMLI